MIDTKRVDEAKSNVSHYLRDGLLVKRLSSPEIISVLVNNARNSIDETFRVQTPLWKIVTSYYAMFYIANAVLSKLGYKVGESIAHKVTSDALIVYVQDKLRKGLLEEYEQVQDEALAGIRANDLVESFDLERRKRSIFQYHTSQQALESKALTSQKRAREFVAELMKLLN